MKKMLIAALMAAFAATALPGAAAAQTPERDSSILLPLAGGLGTANWFLRPHWTNTFKIKKFKKFASAPSSIASGGYRHRRHHKKVGSTRGEFPYVVGAIWCSAASPIITVLIEQRELSTNEVIDSTIGCFFPPWIIIRWLAAQQQSS